MFGWFKKKAQEVEQARSDVAAAAADDAQQGFMRVQGALGGLHPDMSRDPFVVGGLSSHAAILSTIVAGGRCPLHVTEAAMVRSLELVFGSVGVDRTRAISLLMEYKNHPEYTKGTQVSALVLAARFGRKDLQGDPLLVDARTRVRAMPKAFRESFGSSEDEQVSEVLSQDLLVKPMKAKYGELWRTR
jgi:hypothetical protein